MLVAMLGYIASLSSAQVAGNQVSIFIVNMFRFAFEIFFSIGCIWFGNHSLKVARKDIQKVIIASLFNLVYVTLFYLSSTLLPIGNLDGVYGGIYIATTTFVDAVRRQISKWSVFAALIAGTGLILLTQPWHSFKGHMIAPCDVLDSNMPINTSAFLSNASVDASDINTNPLYQWFTPEALGYTYVTIGTLSTCVADIIIRSLLQTYSIYNFLFWGGIVQTLITVIILLVMAYLQMDSLTFPTGTACLSFSIVFIMTMTFSHMLINITFIFLPVSKAAMVTPLATIALYVLQRTALKMFHPGHGNAMEIVGIAAIVIAGILAPVVSIFHESEK